METNTSGIPYNPAAIAATGGNTSFDLARWDVPIIQVSSGSMGNNGAITGLTALPAGSPANVYVVLPAGAIAAGVPAAEDVYFAQLTSTTSATVFNNLLSANLSAKGEPQVPASTTAFVTTGPGAFTGVVTARTLVTIAIPAGAMGTTGQATIECDTEWTTAATNKSLTVAFGGSNLANFTHTTTAQPEYNLFRVKNRGSASVQRSAWMNFFSGGSGTQTNVNTAVNTGNAVNVTFGTQKVTATENLILHGGRIAIVQST